MKWFQGFIEKLLISLLVATVGYVIKLLLSSSVSVPELYLYAGSRVIVGPPYFFFLVSIVGIYFILATMFSGRIVWNRKLEQVCKQFRFYSQVFYFSSNGVSRYNFIRKGGLLCIEICLQNFNLEFTDEEGFTTSADCGIVFSKSRHLFTKGFLIGDKKKMCFEIMGNEGGEQIGVAFKNIHGYEQKYSLSRFLKGGVEKDTWKVVEIDLDEYAHVTRSAYDKAYLENFSIYTNSKLSGDRKIIVYIRNIEFI